MRGLKLSKFSFNIEISSLLPTSLESFLFVLRFIEVNHFHKEAIPIKAIKSTFRNTIQKLLSLSYICHSYKKNLPPLPIRTNKEIKRFVTDHV